MTAPQVCQAAPQNLTVQEVKAKQRNLQSQIRRLISEFEHVSVTTVDSVNLVHAFSLTEGNQLVDVIVEVKL